MPNGWRTKHVGTADWRRSATGATIAPGSSIPTGTVAIIGVTMIGETIVGGPTTEIRGTKVFRAIAATGVTIATHEIIATIAAEEHDNQATLLTIRLCLLKSLVKGTDYVGVIRMAA